MIRRLTALWAFLPAVTVDLTVGALRVVYPQPQLLPAHPDVDGCTCSDDTDPDGPEPVVYRMPPQALFDFCFDAAHRTHNGTDPEEAASEVVHELELTDKDDEET